MSEGFQIGPLLMRWNGFLLVLGIAAGVLLAAYQTKRRGHDPEIVYYLFLPLMIWGTIGARLWHIFTPPLSSVELGLTTKYYLTHALDALAVWTPARARTCPCSSHWAHRKLFQSRVVRPAHRNALGNIY